MALLVQGDAPMTSAYQGVIDTPFDPDVPDLSPETPTLDYLIREAMRLHTMEMRCAMPAYILAVVGNGEVDVQPSLQQRFRSDASAKDLPAIKGVPVCLPGGAQYSIKVPLAVGDSGLLVFADRSLDAWSQSDGSNTVDPGDTRQHNLSDAVFIPGCYPLTQQDDDTTTDLVINSGDAQMRLLQSGKLALGSTASGGQELLSVLDAFMANSIATLDMLAQAMVLTLMGPQPLIAASQLQIAQLKAQAQQIKANLESIKGTP